MAYPAQYFQFLTYFLPLLLIIYRVNCRFKVIYTVLPVLVQEAWFGIPRDVECERLARLVGWSGRDRADPAGAHRAAQARRGTVRFRRVE